MTFGKLILKYRTILCISTQDAAKLAGITPAAWNQIENDKREPQMSTALKIMRGLHIPISDLLLW